MKNNHSYLYRYKLNIDMHTAEIISDLLMIDKKHNGITPQYYTPDNCFLNINVPSDKQESYFTSFNNNSIPFFMNSPVVLKAHNYICKLLNEYTPVDTMLSMMFSQIDESEFYTWYIHQTLRNNITLIDSADMGNNVMYLSFIKNSECMRESIKTVMTIGTSNEFIVACKLIKFQTQLPIVIKNGDKYITLDI